MYIINLTDEEYTIFTDWLKREPFPAEQNFPHITKAFNKILGEKVTEGLKEYNEKYPVSDTIKMLTEACNDFRQQRIQLAKMLNEAQKENTDLVLKIRVLEEKQPIT